MDRHDVDIMAINETWLRDGEEGRAPSVTGYRLRHIPRPPAMRSRGGGVGFYIRRGVVVRTLPHPPAPLVEQMWLCVNVNGKKLLVGTAYRPPWLNVDTFVDALAESLSCFSWCNNVVLLGDFNINLLSITDSSTKKLTDFLTSHTLHQYVTTPTHFTEYSETLIDTISTDIDNTVVVVDYIPELSRHAFITCTLNIVKAKQTPVRITRRNLHTIDYERFDVDLSTIDWMRITHLEDVNDMVRQFSECLVGLFDVHAPLRILHARQRQYPWITYNVKQLVKRRDEAHAAARHSGNDSQKSYYKDLKKVVNDVLISEKKAYYNHYVNKQKDSRVLWAHIKKNVNIKSKPELPTHIFNDPNLINDHFLNVPGSQQSLLSDITYFQQNSKINTKLSLTTVEDNEILQIMRSLKSNAVGLDGISLDMLLLSLPVILPVVTAMVNRSIETNTFPVDWQHAVIRPIPKINNPSNLTDIRPISILSCVSKVLETIVAKQVTNFLESHEVLPNVQSGFRKKHSTTTAMIKVVNDILSAQDNGQGTLLTLLDFSRAFDCINWF
ncbi:uncharacterized protein LOC113236375 [Hyposmocoma kahamanoa]|uniref:uncharacterized protein LOC113236375 n=1 Tax=Hyposmocoma kahamanoa TaxID=1477025 RepID=UPI000E6D6B51|nr:uncharacterized protein LOC113236375 [Hyposmocoma kahamanoa]